MSTERNILRTAQGVTLTEVILRDGATTADRTYVIGTLRSPETTSFASFAEADAQYLAEVEASENDPSVQQRLSKRR